MKKRMMVIIALVLAVLLCGCGDFGDYAQVMDDLLSGGEEIVAYEDMVYERPDMTEFQLVLEESCRLAREERDLDKVIEGVYAFYDVYDWFYTNYSLADIRYCSDLTDIYWEKEYDYCAAQTATVDAGLDALYHALAQSPIRDELEGPDYFGEGYFDYYEGESIWDETFTALMEQESALVSSYYDLCAQALAESDDQETYYEVYGSQMAELFVELVALRQQIADYVGYSSYEQFAYDFYYYRDYTPGQVEDYLAEIQAELVGLYVNLDYHVWSAGWEECDETQTFAYVESCARTMGGRVEEAFELLQEAGLYDISYGENKYNASFEVYLYSYYEPFIFMNSGLTGWDKLTFAHEFGHFANDYACWGSYAGIDVAEVYSQAMEYLSLCYAEGGEDLTTMKLADSLCVFVEQAAYAAFEQQVYELRGSELTAENIQALFQRVGEDYGFDTWGFDSRSFVDITHFYTNPMYIISYVVSNDAALQIYQLELAEPGEGLALFQDSLDSQESYFLSFLDSLGLEGPFAAGRLQSIRQTLEQALK